MSTVFRVEKSGNFTIMSNYHLKDRRLSYKAKGLLSEMLSLPPDWDFTLSGLAAIANDGVSSVRGAIRELESFGYLVRRQSRNELGRMSVNEYFVYECPELNPDFKPSAEDSTPRENAPEGAIFSCPPSDENPPTGNSPTENHKAATYNKLNIHKSKIHESNDPINRASRGERLDEKYSYDNSTSEFFGEKAEYFRAVIHENIDYDWFLGKRGVPMSPDIKLVDRLVETMTSVLCSKRREIRVNGENLPLDAVKRRFLGINGGHIEYVMDSFSKTTTSIKNLRAYLITALYNAPETIGDCFALLPPGERF